MNDFQWCAKASLYILERKLSLKKHCHILEVKDGWMWVKKNETQFSDECKDRNLAWHQMSLPWWILFFFFFLIFTSKCRRVIRAKFISFLINFFATYCNILSVNNEMKMLQILQCVVSRRGEGESERLWQLVCAPSFALAVYDFLISLQVPRRVANNIFLGCCASEQTFFFQGNWICSLEDDLIVYPIKNFINSTIEPRNWKWFRAFDL